MAIVILPPGNKFKILNRYEVIQLTDVLKSSGELKQCILNLEDKCKTSDDVYDIDLVSTTATPLSQLGSYQDGIDDESIRIRKETARGILKRRRSYRRKPVRCKEGKTLPKNKADVSENKTYNVNSENSEQDNVQWDVMLDKEELNKL